MWAYGQFFDGLVPRDMTIYVTYIYSDLYAMQVSGFSFVRICENIVGVWSSFDVFVPLFGTTGHVCER